MREQGSRGKGASSNTADLHLQARPETHPSPPNTSKMKSSKHLVCAGHRTRLLAQPAGIGRPVVLSPLKL